MIALKGIHTSESRRLYLLERLQGIKEQSDATTRYCMIIGAVQATLDSDQEIEDAIDAAFSGPRRLP